MTALVTTSGRIELVLRLVQELREMHPLMDILVADDGGLRQEDIVDELRMLFSNVNLGPEGSLWTKVVVKITNFRRFTFYR